MARAVRRHDWSAAFVEIIVVIVGLMLAFQLDRWWEQRGDRAQEAEYVARLIADVEADVVALEHAVALQTIRLDLANLLMAVVEDPEEATRRPVEFLGAVMQSTFLYTPVPTMHTFEDLRSTGNMRLLRDPDLKGLLYGYYSYEANQRQFQAIWYGKHLRHQALAAGIVSHEQYRFIHDTWTYFGPEEIDEVRAAEFDLDSVRATVGRFLERRELVEWLPQTRVMQIEQITRNTSLLDKANAVLDELRAYRDLLTERIQTQANSSAP